MFSTQYTLAQRFANIGSGNNDRTIFADIAARFADLSEQIGYLSVKARGAKGDGANTTNRHDDTNSILDAITEASLSGRGIEFPAGVYYITKNITIYDCKFYKGAILLPAQDVFINILGHCDAGFYQIFNCSLLGYVDFWNNQVQNIAKCCWWGVKGDAITDDSNAWDLSIYCVDDSSAIEVPTRLTSLLSDTFVITDRSGIRIFSHTNPDINAAVAGTPFPGFLWNGPVGGTMVALWTTIKIHLLGLGFYTDDFSLTRNKANIAIDCDGETAFWTYTSTIQTTAGSDIITVIPPTSPPETKYRSYFYRQQRGRNINITGDISTTVKRWISKTQIQLNAPCTNTLINTSCNIQKRYTLGTACEFERLAFANQNPNVNLFHLRISQDAKSNQEYHIIRDCVGFGGSNYDPLLNGCNSTIGSNVINTPYQTQFGWPTRRFRMYGIGNNVTLPDGTVERGGVDCFVGVVIDNHNFTIVDSFGAPVSAQATVTGVTGFVGTGAGVGTYIGPSPNAKKISYYNNSFTKYESAHRMDNGSCQHTSENLVMNEYNYKLLASSEPIYLDGDNSENSRHHLLQTCDGPVSLRSARLDNSQTDVNQGYIQFGNPGECIFHMLDCNVEMNPGLGSTIFDSYTTPGNPRITVNSGSQLGATTWGKLGLSQTGVFNGRYIIASGPIDHSVGDTVVPAEVRFRHPIHSIASNKNGAFSFKAETWNNLNTGESCSGYLVHLNQSFLATGGNPTGLEIHYAPNGNIGGAANQWFIGASFKAPSSNSTTSFKAIRHLWAESPVILNGVGVLPSIEFIYSEPLKTTNVTKAYFIHGLGVSDIVNYKGPSYLGAPTASPDLTELANSQLSWNVDEVGNKLIFTVRYSGGTVKTGSVNLI